MAFATNHTTNPVTAWQLFALAVIWPLIYDTQYALADIEDDQKIGVHSSAIWLGEQVIIVITLLQTIFVTGWIYLAYQLNFHTPAYLLLSSTCLLFAYQFVLTQHKNPTQCLHAFHTNNSVGAIIFIAIMLEYLVYGLR